MNECISKPSCPLAFLDSSVCPLIQTRNKFPRGSLICRVCLFPVHYTNLQNLGKRKPHLSQQHYSGVFVLLQAHNHSTCERVWVWVCVDPAHNLVASSITGVPPVGLSGDGGQGGVCQEDGEMPPAEAGHVKSKCSFSACHRRRNPMNTRVSGWL